ncbi:chromo domain-containing protein [Verticillium dahliae]
MPVGSRYHYCERYGGDPLSDVDDVSMADAQSELSDDEPEPLIVSDIATPTPKTDPVHPVKRGAGRPLKKSKLPTSTKADTKKASARNGTETGLQDGKSDASISGEDDQDCASDGDDLEPEDGEPLVSEFQSSRRLFPSRPIGRHASSGVDNGKGVPNELEELSSTDGEGQPVSPTPAKRGPGRPPKKDHSSSLMARPIAEKKRASSSADSSKPRRSSRLHPSVSGSGPVTKAKPAKGAKGSSPMRFTQTTPQKSTGNKLSTPQSTASKVHKRRGRPSKAKTSMKREQDAEQEWEVESIEDSLIDRKGGVHYYQVKWKGFPASQNTWEPRASLSKCKDMITAFQQRSKKTQKSKR